MDGSRFDRALQRREAVSNSTLFGGAGGWGHPLLLKGAKPAGCSSKPVGEVCRCELSGKTSVGTVAFGSAETGAERGAGILNPPLVIVQRTMERMRLCWAAQEVRSALLLFHNSKPINSD